MFSGIKNKYLKILNKKKKENRFFFCKEIKINEHVKKAIFISNKCTILGSWYFYLKQRFIKVTYHHSFKNNYFTIPRNSKLFIVFFFFINIIMSRKLKK